MEKQTKIIGRTFNLNKFDITPLVPKTLHSMQKRKMGVKHPYQKNYRIP